LPSTNPAPEKVIEVRGPRLPLRFTTVFLSVKIPRIVPF
jgi:hypothetical protein